MISWRRSSSRNKSRLLISFPLITHFWEYQLGAGAIFSYYWLYCSDFYNSLLFLTKINNFVCDREHKPHIYYSNHLIWLKWYNGCPLKYVALRLSQPILKTCQPLIINAVGWGGRLKAALNKEGYPIRHHPHKPIFGWLTADDTSPSQHGIGRVTPRIKDRLVLILPYLTQKSVY